MNKTVVCVLSAPQHPEPLFDALLDAGFDNRDISVAWLDEKHHGASDDVTPVATDVPGVAAAGASTGGYLGGTLGIFAGVGALVIPGLGPLYALGPLLSMFTGAAAGAAIGGMMGGLVGLGIPETEAQRYDALIRQGRMLISVHVATPGQARRAKQICLEHGGQDIYAITESEQAPAEQSQTT